MDTKSDRDTKAEEEATLAILSTFHVSQHTIERARQVVATRTARAATSTAQPTSSERGEYRR